MSEYQVEQSLRVRMLSIILDELKATQKPWEQLNKYEQDDALRRIDRRVRGWVNDAVDEILSYDLAHVRLAVNKVEFTGSGTKVACTGRSDEGVHELADRAGLEVLVLLVDPDRWLEGELPKADEDQWALFEEEVPDDWSEAGLPKPLYAPCDEPDCLHTWRHFATVDGDGGSICSTCGYVPTSPNGTVVEFKRPLIALDTAGKVEDPTEEATDELPF